MGTTIYTQKDKHQKENFTFEIAIDQCEWSLSVQTVSHWARMMYRKSGLFISMMLFTSCENIRSFVSVAL